MMKHTHKTQKLITAIAPVVFATITAAAELNGSTLPLSSPLTSTVANESIVAQGGVFYKMPDGSLLTRDASLEVPARGQGNVVLRSGSVEFVAHGFKTVHSRGRAVFYVAFINPVGAPENTAVIFRGSYIRGGDKATYWGDVFTKTYDDNGELSDLTQTPGIDAFVADFEASSLDGSEWRHSGGFWFKAGE